MSAREVDDATFMENVREARSNGFERCCSECGCGIYDDSDWHDVSCSEFVDHSRTPNGSPR